MQLMTAFAGNSSLILLRMPKNLYLCWIAVQCCVRKPREKREH